MKIAFPYAAPETHDPAVMAEAPAHAALVRATPGTGHFAFADSIRVPAARNSATYLAPLLAEAGS